MINKQVRIGFDRFLALEWTNYSLELYQSSQNLDEDYHRLKTYLQKEIVGAETARKTANQLKRLWLQQDTSSPLREKVIQEQLFDNLLDRPFLHYGMAFNVFPLFHDVSNLIGSHSHLGDGINRDQLKQRVLEKYGNPVTLPRATDRVIQTLENWGFISNVGGVCSVKQTKIQDPKIANWLVIQLFK